MRGERVACIKIGAEVSALVAFFYYALVEVSVGVARRARFRHLPWTTKLFGFLPEPNPRKLGRAP
jgi:hypothetical protein